MSKPAVKAIPDGMHSLTPYLICAGATEAIAFYKKAFGAVELSKVANTQGKLLNAQIRIGNSWLMLMDEFADFGALGPKSLKGSPVSIHLQVEDVDAAFAKAVAAGAKVTMPVSDQFWGDRFGQIEDPFGHRWSLGTHIRDVSPEEMDAQAKKMMNGHAGS